MPRGGSRANAGRPGRAIKVEDCRSLDIREFHKAGLLKGPWAGTWRWTNMRTGTVSAWINLAVYDDFLRLGYKCDGQTFHEEVRLSKLPCHFGGNRLMFVCNGCQRRTQVLLMRQSRFRCRHCHDLRYRSQSEDAIGRAWLAQAKLSRQLGPGLARPHGMKRAKYERLRAQILEYEIVREDLLDTILARML